MQRDLRGEMLQAPDSFDSTGIENTGDRKNLTDGASDGPAQPRNAVPVPLRDLELVVVGMDEMDVWILRILH